MQDTGGIVQRWVVLLRGINVGGRRSLPMARVREVLTDAGCADVTTYLQSGNAVCRDARTEAVLRTELERRLAAAAGFEVAVVLRTAAQIRSTVRANPFAGRDPATLHVAFFQGRPERSGLERLPTGDSSGEEWRIVRRDLYLSLPNGVGRAKLPQQLSRIGTPATVRSWRTVTQLVARSA